MPKSHIQWDKESKAYECSCGYLGAHNQEQYREHELDYQEAVLMNEDIIWHPALDAVFGEPSPADMQRLVHEYQKPYNTYGGMPVVYSDLVPKNQVLIVDKDLWDETHPDNFDNSGRHIFDICPETTQWKENHHFDSLRYAMQKPAGRHYARPKKKWYYLWLK